MSDANDILGPCSGEHIVILSDTIKMNVTCGREYFLGVIGNNQRVLVFGGRANLSKGEAPIETRACRVSGLV